MSSPPRQRPVFRPDPPYRTKRETALADALTNYTCAHLWGAANTDEEYGEEDYAQLTEALTALGVGWRRTEDTEGNPTLVVDPDWLAEVFAPRAERYDKEYTRR